jgi:amino acid adenylation domain-containing protein
MNTTACGEALRSKQVTYWRSRNLDPGARSSLLARLSRDPRCPGRERRIIDVPLGDEASENLLRIAGGSDLAVYVLVVTMFKAVTARYTGESLVSLVSPLYRDRSAGPGRIVADGDHVLLQDRVELAGGLKENAPVTQRTVVGAYSNQAFFRAGLAGAPAGELVERHVLIAFNAIHDTGALWERSPLALRLRRDGAKLAGELGFDPHALQAGLVEQFARHLAAFFERSSRDTSRAFGDIELLSDPEKDRIDRFSRGARRPIEECRLHELVQEQARRTPAVTALVFGGERTSYRELDELSDAVARGLVRGGVRPGDFVAMLCSRSVEMIAAMLGIGKAGAAFVPVSPQEPKERLDRILGETHPRCVVTNLDVQGVGGAGPVLTVPELTSAAGGSIALPASHELPTDALAYAIFTSGSTGTPKGVLIEHRGSVNAVRWRRDAYQLSPAHRVLLVFPYHFDAFVLNLFSPLAAGATTVLVKDEEAADPSSLARYLRAYEITHLTSTPQVYQAILEECTERDLASLASVALAGDVTRPPTLALSKTLKPGLVLSNEYGPTENSVVSTYQARMDAESLAVIGVPIENVDVHILDAGGRPVPVGVLGEIVLAGPGLARGYLNDPAQTAERFVSWRGERIYLTGDVGRWRLDGGIEFHGRTDDQVKVRGHRIELEEVRRRLLSHDGVKEAVAFIDETVPDGAIVACITESHEVDRDALLEHLRGTLPAYMVPGEVIRLSEMPLAESGKIDLSRIKARVRALRAQATDDLPATDIERALAVIWSKLLDLESVGVDKSFFALGGHSLKATRLLTRIRAEFDVDLPLDEIFKSNTIRKLAATIQRQRTHRGDGIGKVPESPSYLVSPAQQRMLVLAQDESLQASYVVTVSFAIVGELDLERLELAVDAVVRRHDSLRTYFVYEGKRAMQAIDRACKVPIRRLSIAAGTDLAAALRALRTRFDVSRAPLLAVTLLDADERGRLLVFEFHHIIVDETSLGIFFRDLDKAYNGVELDPVPLTPYVDYAAWQRERRASPAYLEKLEYWSGKLAGATLGPVDLPYEAGAERSGTGSGGQHVVGLDRELTGRIRDLCRDEELTLFMFFGATFTLHLHRVTGQEEIVIGAPISERLRPETHDVVGLFLNTLLLHHRIDRRSTVRQLLQSAKQELLRDFANSEVQLEDILARLPIRRSADNRSAFNVMLTTIEDGIEPILLGSATATPVDLHDGTAKFDLLLEVRASEDDIRLVFEYSRARLSQATVESLGVGFVGLLRSIVAEPDTPVADLRGGDEQRVAAPAPARAGAAPRAGGGRDAPGRAAARRAPATALERELVSTWADVLGIAPDSISVDDSFFMLGGDSVGVTVVALKIRSWGCPVKLGEIFENDTIEKLGAVVGGRMTSSPEQRRLPASGEVPP